jgi:hypothetical protein
MESTSCDVVSVETTQKRTESPLASSDSESVKENYRKGEKRLKKQLTN